VAGVALVAGLLFLLMAVFRLGWISQFLSKAVITGFLFGAAIDVSVGELSKLTARNRMGRTSGRSSAPGSGLDDGLSGTTLIVGVISLVALFGLRAVAPKVPGTLVVVLGGILASVLFDLGTHGVALVGDVPRGLPVPGIPT